jgi:hypothetical protein
MKGAQIFPAATRMPITPRAAAAGSHASVDDARPPVLDAGSIPSKRNKKPSSPRPEEEGGLEGCAARHQTAPLPLDISHGICGAYRQQARICEIAEVFGWLKCFGKSLRF